MIRTGLSTPGETSLVLTKEEGHGTLLPCVQLGTTRIPSSFSVELLCTWVASANIDALGLFLPRHRLSTCPCWTSGGSWQHISPVCQGPLDDSVILWHPSHSSVSGIINKLGESALWPITQVLNEQDWTQCYPCGTLLVTDLQLQATGCNQDSSFGILFCVIFVVVPQNDLDVMTRQHCYSYISHDNMKKINLSILQ